MSNQNKKIVVFVSALHNFHKQQIPFYETFKLRVSLYTLSAFQFIIVHINFASMFWPLVHFRGR